MAFHIKSSNDSGDYYFERSADFLLQDNVALARVVRTKLTGTLADPLRRLGARDWDVLLNGSWAPKNAEQQIDSDNTPQLTREIGDFGYGYNRGDLQATAPDAPKAARLFEAALKCPLWFPAVVIAPLVTVAALVKRRGAARSTRVKLANV